MNQSQFVFSQSTKWILYRHLSFWCCWYLFQVYLYAFLPSPMLTQLGFGLRLQLTAIESFFYLLPGLFLTYMLIYVILPKLVIPAHYLRASISIVLLLALTAALSAFISLTIIDSVRWYFFSSFLEVRDESIQTPFNVQLFLALMGGLRGSITVGGLAAAIKLTKYFYVKQQHALVLEKEKMLAELQSLKAQLHPHFLFNTLNNIYAHTQIKAPEAAEMVMGLAELLRYIIYTCTAPLVPLVKEIEMMKQYIELEKSRYGNELDIAVDVPSGHPHLMIAPLLLLPFIENSFKHGASSLLEHPWITIHISLQGEWMHLKLVNGKSRATQIKSGGIGIDNVRRRLQLLYPDRYDLSIIEEEEVYIVNLQLDLSTQPADRIQDIKRSR